MPNPDTIAAVATPRGSGGIGIVRISGPLCSTIGQAIIGSLPAPRNAHYGNFVDADGAAIDQGIAIFFPAPQSFTGEDVLELQGHGGQLVMDLLLQRVLGLGARLAQPGEFTERAFLNDKLDLAQAEAIADLIEADTAASARLASRSLQGVFSEKIGRLVEKVVELRVYVEAAIDFPEEEIDFLSDKKVSANLRSLVDEIMAVQKSAHTGRLLKDGLTLVIAGRPNAGKSSLLNALAGAEAAIVTETPGTTRDPLRERISIDGMPLHLIDTAGLRVSNDPIEQEGVRRARKHIEQADGILWVFDDRADPEHLALDRNQLPAQVPLILIRNKIDLSGKQPYSTTAGEMTEIGLVAKTGDGIELLRQHLKRSAGYTEQSDSEFSARRRHLDALRRALGALHQGAEVLQTQQAGELLAEELRLAQNSLNEITGEFSSDDLLGEIFTGFCIGK